MPSTPKSTSPGLWSSGNRKLWREALDSYVDVVERQKVKPLAELDRWYREELPSLIAARRVPHVTLPELARITEWKMARGVYRAPNLILVRGNDPAAVIETSRRALADIPHPTSPIATLASLDGVGPATASGVASAAVPEIYPFFDELVAQQVPGLGKIAWTLGFYAKYASAIRERAERLGNDWSPVMVERALWAHVGGKSG
ncbi:MAG: hypothetical protein M3081_22310 [Gemmatimonadota bacterium]|nr:hypothetical protein [Gemmatimonadota bacterium]